MTPRPWITLALVACFATTAVAAVPGELHYQGYLTDTAGAPVHCPDAESCDDVFNVTFRAYDSAAEGAPLWEETHEAVSVSHGLFNLRLGTQTPLSAAVLGDPTWLGLEVNDAGELMPRQRIVSAAFSLRASQAEAADTAAMADDADRLGGIDAADYALLTDLPGLCVTDDELDAVLAQENNLNVEELHTYLTDSGYVSGPHFSGQWTDLEGVPVDLADGDDDTLGSMSCEGGAIATFDGLAWSCGVDAVLTEDAVDAMVANNGYAQQSGLDALQAEVANLPAPQWTPEGASIRAVNAPNVVVTDTGRVGIGTTAPGQALDVAGGVKIGDATLCDTESAGTIRWNGATFEGCNGSAWAALGGGGGGPPAGTIVGWATSTAPDGYLECDGASMSRSTYPDLFAAIGTSYGSSDQSSFNLPNFRGEFLRGWSHGSGADPNAGGRSDRGDGTTGDQVGTRQGHELQSHGHDMGRWMGGNPGYQYPFTDPNQDNALLDNGGPNSNVHPTGGSETRPRNVNVMWLIKI